MHGPVSYMLVVVSRCCRFRTFSFRFQPIFYIHLLFVCVHRILKGKPFENVIVIVGKMLRTWLACIHILEQIHIVLAVAAAAAVVV